MPAALIALGANLGERHATIERAFESLAKINRTQLLRRSYLHATAPIGGPAGQPEFLNAAALLSTSLTPTELLSHLHAIEATANRTRIERWQARTLDLDLLLYDDLQLHDQRLDDQQAAVEALVVPHPRMSFRRFVLEPAVDVAPGMVHPTSGWTLAALLSHLREAPAGVAVGGENTRESQWLYQALREKFSEESWPSYEKGSARPQLCIWLGDDPPAEVLQGPAAVLDPTHFETKEKLLAEAIAAVEASR